MPNIAANYTSPWARWALLLEDHPGSTHDYTVATGDELGIPEAFGGGDRKFCVCTITLPDGTTHVGWKAPESNKGDSDEWVKIQAKALGRACKKAGYPDNTDDLKAVLLWRRRLAEIGAIGAPALEAGDKPEELAPAPATSDDAPAETEDDPDDRYVDPDTGEITEAEVVETIDPKTVDLATLPQILSNNALDTYEASAQQAGIKDAYAPASKAEEAVLRGLLEEAVKS